MSEIGRAIEKKEYIERGAFLNWLNKRMDEVGTDKESRFYINQTMTILESYPTADVEPVVRGECEHCSSRIQATNDGQPFSQEWYLTVNGCKFCPQCGRKLHMERSGSGE